MENGDIQKLKLNIGQAAEHIIADGVPLLRKGKKYHCFNTSAHRNGDKDPSMSWDKEALQFYCFTCNEKIDIYRYYREFEEKSHREIMEKFGMSSISNQQETKIKIKKRPLQEKQFDYLWEERGLTEETVSYFNLSDNNGNIEIPYINQGIVTGIKIKNLKPSGLKYFSESGSKFGFFNKQNVATEKPRLIICEGEFDCMVLHQCNYENVVSVGTGANSLAYLFKQENDFLKMFGSLIILSDNDEAGANMTRAFLQKFNYKVKLPDKALYLDCKDVNEVYLKYGAEQIAKIINSATVKIEGLRNLDLDPYKGVIDQNGHYISTGLPALDHAINDLAPGLVSLVTGRSNGGKSTFVNQVMCNAIDKGNKVLLVAGEGLQELLINNIYKAMIGRDEDNYEYVKVNKRYFKEPKPRVLKALQQWHKGKLTLFNKGESSLKTTEELFDLLNIEIKADLPNLLVIDNLMSVLSVEKANEKLERQADFMQKCCDLAKNEKIHIILVLHPNKTAGKNSGMDFEQISGTQDLANKADNIILVRRYYSKEVDGIESDGVIEVLKNRYFSDLPKIETHYDQETGMLLEINDITGDFIAYSFRWKQYLEKKPGSLFN